MHSYELLAIACYLTILLFIGIFSYRKHLSDTDFLLGGRSLNYWLTALAAHASDMSSWLFMGYPATIFEGGLFYSWSAIGLILFMYLNWQWIAPKIRIASEKYNSYTLSSFFESRFQDQTGRIRIFTALMSFFFYTIYISSGLIGLGLLLETLFGLNYYLAVLLGVLLIVPYVFTGGYVTLAWIDLFQGLFLMLAIIFVPLYIASTLPTITTFEKIFQIAAEKKICFLPDLSCKTCLEILFMTAGWGLGYFGQPHILTKFMGIKKVEEISKSKYIGMSWMTLSLGAATLVGLVATAFFPEGIQDSEEIFIEMVKRSFHPLLVGLILCAVLATTINAMSSQILVLSSSLTEDFYKRIIHKTASTKHFLRISRLSVVLVALIAFFIAYGKPATIYSLVFYAWSGLGSTFGPLLLFSLYSKKITKQGAWAGILSGGIVSGVWPYLNSFFQPAIPSLLPGFLISSLAILTVSHFSYRRAL